MTEIKIILADDHNIVRAGVRSLLDKIPGMKVIAETGNGREVIDFNKKVQTRYCTIGYFYAGIEWIRGYAISVKRISRNRDYNFICA
jgi:DNA-binding NarL/FixJ family response regulator